MNTLLRSLFGAVALLAVSCGHPDFGSMADEMAGQGPVWKSDSIPAGAILLDAREAEEYAVSHLSGALHVGCDPPALQGLASLPKDTLLIVYCSVGYRSGQVAEELVEMGFTNVWNLWGGIFHWVNEGRPVVDAHGPTAHIHPYNARWAQWLQRGEQRYDP